MKKIDKLEAAGDKLVSKGDYKKALKKYKEAAKEDPSRMDLYDKMVDAHEHIDKNWDKKDFVESLSWTMKKQEIEEPAIRQLHAKLTPEWKRTLELAIKVINAPENGEFPKLVEKLVGTGEIGTRVLVDLIRLAKKPEERGDE